MAPLQREQRGRWREQRRPCLNNVADGGSEGVEMTEAFEMTERFLEKQTTNFYSFFYSRRHTTGNKLGEI